MWVCIYVIYNCKNLYICVLWYVIACFCLCMKYVDMLIVYMCVMVRYSMFLFMYDLCGYVYMLIMFCLCMVYVGMYTNWAIQSNQTFICVAPIFPPRIHGSNISM